MHNNLPPWNKGLKGCRHNLTEKSLKNIREPNKKHKQWKKAVEASKKLDKSGENNGMFGKHHSLETRNKISAKAKLRKPHFKKVKCITDNLEFKSLIEAGKYYNMSGDRIRHLIKMKKPNKNGKLFEYY